MRKRDGRHRRRFGLMQLGDSHPRWSRRLSTTLRTVLVLLVAVNVMHQFGPRHADLLVGPAAAALLIVLARRAGLTWDDLGLSRRTWGRGLAYGAGAVAAVAVVYAIGVALPVTRTAFLDARYRLHLDNALLLALVVIPLRTVLFEEVAFRGVLLGLLHRRRAAWVASGISSALFGLWHIAPSLHLGQANRAVGAAIGHTASAQALVVAGVVVFTGLSGVLFCELRRRSGSLLACVGLHWATNGLAVLTTAVVWHYAQRGLLAV